jgi:hypothetical protein
VSSQHCGYLNKKCIKVRKSDPNVTIGTCSVLYGKNEQAIIICPHRMLEKRKVFIDCIHLLQLHEPGNEFHVIPEVSVPGGTVDYILASVRAQQVMDFVGIELQSFDTTGTIWPDRQRFLAERDLIADSLLDNAAKPFGMNWKMTAKTTLVQLHHKLETFEYLNKHLVLVLQDHLLNYMKKAFHFAAIHTVAKLGDPMHFHAYQLGPGNDDRYTIQLHQRLSTSRAGLAAALGLKSEATIELAIMTKILESKISDLTLLTI